MGFVFNCGQIYCDLQGVKLICFRFAQGSAANELPDQHRVEFHVREAALIQELHQIAGIACLLDHAAQRGRDASEQRRA